MRILGYVAHPHWKITVFKTDTRLSIKLENGQFEQTYKFRPAPHHEGMKEIRDILDEPFLAQVEAQFAAMEKSFAAAFTRTLPEASEDDFPEII